jgi:hypothetical protein
MANLISRQKREKNIIATKHPFMSRETETRFTPSNKVRLTPVKVRRGDEEKERSEKKEKKLLIFAVIIFYLEICATPDPSCDIPRIHIKAINKTKQKANQATKAADKRRQTTTRTCRS